MPVSRPRISGFTRVFGIVGHPVHHSQSPGMHNRLFQTLGIDAVYVAFDVAPERSDRVADLVRTMNLSGVNLTVPHKEHVVPDLDGLSAEAQRAGAVNVIINQGGRLVGHNTDGLGFGAALDHAGESTNRAHAVILGAGGSARAVAAELLNRGVPRITLLNRTEGRAAAAIAALASHQPAAMITAGPLSIPSFSAAAEGADLVVNCTSGPAVPLIETLDPNVLASSAAWVDINYWMPSPPLQDAIVQSGRTFHDGLGMLAFQGALSFELFTQQAVDGGDVLAILRSEL